EIHAKRIVYGIKMMFGVDFAWEVVSVDGNVGRLARRARKSHIEGAIHQNNVKLHYDSYKDPVELLLENCKKSPCRKFCESGYCPFGLSCKYSHVPYGVDFSIIDPHLYLAQNPILLQQQRPQLFTKQQGGQSLQQKPIPMFKYKLPSGISLRDLPPSLRPPPPMGYDFSKAAQW
ncbi:1548_t:CDS:2, partial [Scutellospora calospora]